MKKTLTGLLILACLLGGCSSSFVYRNLDWLVYWYVDDYVELDVEQKLAFDQYLHAWLRWHKDEELSRYKAHLMQLKTQLYQGPLTAEMWLMHMNKGRGHWNRLRNQLSEDLAVLSVKMTDEQVDEFFAAITKQIEEQREEEEKLTEDEKFQERIENLRAGLKDYIGSLSTEQRELASEYATMLKPNDFWLDYRQRVTNAAREIINSRYQDSHYLLKLTELLRNPEQYKTSHHVQVSDYNRRVYAQYLASINKTLTEKQRSRLVKKIDGVVEDLIDLQDD